MENTNIKSHLSINCFLDGLKSGMPIALGYIPIAIAFGLLTKSNGLPDYVAILMSLLVFAGASQFVGVNLIALGTSPFQIIMTTFILNFRHFLMSSSLALRMEQNVSKGLLSVLSFGITDETFSVASLNKQEKLAPGYILGLNLISFIAWNIGTIVGIFAAAGLPQSIADSMGIALYAMFIGLLVPSVKKSLPLLVIALTAVLSRSMLHWIPMFSSISKGWQIIISTVIGAGLGACLFPGEVKDNE